MTSGHAQCTSRAAASQEWPRTSFRFADKKELYVESFANASAHKGHFHCQPHFFSPKDVLDPCLFTRLQLTTCGTVYHFSHPSRMSKLSLSRSVSEVEFWSWATHHQQCIEELFLDAITFLFFHRAVSATITICSSSQFFLPLSAPSIFPKLPQLLSSTLKFKLKCYHSFAASLRRPATVPRRISPLL